MASCAEKLVISAKLSPPEVEFCRNEVSIRMAPSFTTLPISFIHHLLDCATLDAAQREKLLIELGIPLDLMEQDGARVTTDQFANVYLHLVRELDDEAPGLFSRPLRGGTLKFLCLSLLESNNLKAALYRFTRFFRLVLDDLSFEVSQQEGVYQLALVPHTAAARENSFAQDMMLKLAHGVMSWLAAHTLPLARVDFAYKRPSHASDYVFFYPGPAYFDQPATALYFEADLLSAPVRQDRSTVGHFLRRAPGDWMFASVAERIVSHRVREYLAKRLELPTSINDAARALHFSLRSLSRHLHEEGTSFQAIKDELRRDVAIQRLTMTSLAVAEVGAQVGFTDVTTFHRAFKRWTGSAPGHYRRRLFS